MAKQVIKENGERGTRLEQNGKEWSVSYLLITGETRTRTFKLAEDAIRYYANLD